MKKMLFVFFILIVCTIFLGCVSTVVNTVLTNPAPPAEYIVEADPNNPYQGTWLQLAPSGPLYVGGRHQYLIVIEGNIATTYLFEPGTFGSGRGWNRISVSPVNDNYWISDDGNILTVNNISYERVKEAE